MANKLLLADDSPTIAKILGMALQSEKYEIRSVLTAEDAEKELRSNPPNYFLVDLTLPGKNGYEFASMIRKDSKLKQIKVVLLASAFDPADEEEVAKCGANGVITKPFDPSDLRERLRNLSNEPMKYPLGSKVEGNLSGTSVTPVETNTSPSFPTVQIDPLELHLSPSTAPGDANDILSGSLDFGSSDSAPTKPALDLDRKPTLDGNFNSGSPLSADSLLADSLPANAEGTEGYQPTLQIDLSGGAPEFTPQEQILDLSESFHGDAETPPAPPPAKLATRPEASQSIEATSSKTKTSLSANAQALAAFFAAEIDSKTTPSSPSSPSNLPPPSIPKAPAYSNPPRETAPLATPPPMAPAAFPEPSDSFDASLDSIEWGESPKNLNSWSSSSLGKPQPSAKPTAKPANLSSPPPPPPVSSGSGASSGEGSFMFDTGGSSFRFAEDYVHRITKAFTGSPDEMILGKDPSPPKPQAIFPRTSSDTPPPMDSGFPRAELPNTGRGAWTPDEEKRIEQLVKEEVQMVVREVAEKVAWEVIPELAENIIRKELDKVLKEMEE
jgi:DNA-binding response OmpR family regulator